MSREQPDGQPVLGPVETLFPLMSWAGERVTSKDSGYGIGGTCALAAAAHEFRCIRDTHLSRGLWAPTSNLRYLR